MPRQKKTRTQTAPNLSGPLGLALEKHAERRALYFFLQLFYLQATCDLIAIGTGRFFDLAALVREAATHQIDSGYRQTSGHDKFPTADALVVHSDATGFSSTDAAHFCNLGLSAEFDQLASIARGDPNALAMVEMCEVIAGDTCQLPQQVNIGPDRVVDQLHFELASEFLREPNPIFTPEHVAIYATRCDAALRLYAAAKDREQAHGLAACARCYLLPYGNLYPLIEHSLRPEIDEECRERGLDRSDYRSL